MVGSSTHSQDLDAPIVDPDVWEGLLDLDEHDSFVRGTIVDISTINKDDPYENFSVDKREIITSSQTLVEQMANSQRHEYVIAVAVRLPSDGIFIDLFTYEDSSTSDYPLIGTLARVLDIDTADVHHLVGKTVGATRKGGRWKVCEQNKVPPIESTVTWRNFLEPFFISVLLIPIAAITGWYSEFNVILSAALGTVGAVMVYGLLLYLTMATRRDHPLPGFLQSFIVPDFTDGVGKLSEDSPVRDVEAGEFARIITMVDDESRGNERAVMRNIGIVVNIPPEGEVTVPLPAPASSWDRTRIKRLIYWFSPSVSELDRSQGDLVPLRTEDGIVEVDPDRLTDDVPRKHNRPEALADMYVTKINTVFGIQTRSELYF